MSEISEKAQLELHLDNLYKALGSFQPLYHYNGDMAVLFDNPRFKMWSAELSSVLAALSTYYPDMLPTITIIRETISKMSGWHDEDDIAIISNNCKKIIDSFAPDHSKGDAIFISHGHSELLKLKLKVFINEKLGKPTVILSELPNEGMTIVEKLESASEHCSKAIILLTKDDKADGGMRARQNVIHEVGFFQGKYGRKNVVLLCEKGVELFSNISGIVRIEFEAENFSGCFEEIRTELT